MLSSCLEIIFAEVHGCFFFFFHSPVVKISPPAKINTYHNGKVEEIWKKNVTVRHLGSLVMSAVLSKRARSVKFKRLTKLESNCLHTKRCPESSTLKLQDFTKHLHAINTNTFKPLSLDYGANQLHSGLRDGSDVDKLLRKLLERFKNVNFAFGYGSKVFPQGKDVDVSNSQIDMILAVRDPVSWHEYNILKNGADYSSLKYLGPRAVSYVGKLGAGVYFNPFVNVTVDGVPLELKYGVTSKESIVDDLTNWSTMYLAGRLHKPVAILEKDPMLILLNQYSLTSAFSLSLLLLHTVENHSVDEFEIFLKIAGLSYMGDPRLKVNGENPNKVRNIVENQYGLFRELYRPIMTNMVESRSSKSSTFKTKVEKEQLAEIIMSLPRGFRSKIFQHYSKISQTDPISNDIILNPTVKGIEDTNGRQRLSYEELSNTTLDISKISNKDWEYLPIKYKLTSSPFLQAMVNEFYGNPTRLQNIIIKCIEETVGSSALVQSVKGILTAGVARSFKYAMAKRAKYKQSTKKSV